MTDLFIETKKALIQVSIMDATPVELELVWLPKIIGNQTDDEVDKKETKYINGTGLNGADAPIVTSIWDKIKKGGHLTDRHVIYLKKILPKYWRQYAKMQVVKEDLSEREISELNATMADTGSAPKFY